VKLITTLKRTQENKIIFTEFKEALQCTLKFYMDVIFVSYCSSKILNSDIICNDANFMLHSTKSTSPNIRYKKKYLQIYVYELYCITVPFLFVSQATFWDNNETHRVCCVLMVSTVSHFSEIQESLIWALCKIWLVLDKYGPQVNSLRKHQGRTHFHQEL